MSGKSICKCMSFSNGPMDRVAKVRVIYTGGTIGMQRNKNNSLIPVGNVLKQFLLNTPDCHDKNYHFEVGGSSHETFLALPEIEGYDRRIIYDIVEYSPLLDSSNMHMKDWLGIAKDIEVAYQKYDGFVVLHGTDTLSFTASALSFILENLNKPVVLTGSQVSIFEARTDAKENLFSAILIAGCSYIPEVTIYFGGQLLRGNRTTKISSTSFKAFCSSNAPPLAVCGTNIDIRTSRIFYNSCSEDFRAHDQLEENIALIRFYPNISHATVRAMLQEPTKGVILQSFGSGNLPTNRKELLEELKRATMRGIIIVNITQCLKGTVSSTYESGTILVSLGILPGYDMTQEAAFTKLSYVLSKYEWSLKKKKQKMLTNLRGELTCPKPLNSLFIKNGKEHISRKSHDSTDSSQNNKEYDVKKLTKTLQAALIVECVVDNNIEKLYTLKDEGADLNTINFDGRSALHTACYTGNTEIVELLLKNGCSTSQRDRFNRTPLHEAIDTDNQEIIILLSQAGGPLNDSPRTLADCLCSLAQRGAVKRLESYHLAGVDLTLPDRTGRTTLHVAAEMGDVKLTEYLMKHYDNKLVRDNLGHTPLDCARISGNAHITQLLKTEDLETND